MRRASREPDVLIGDMHKLSENLCQKVSEKMLQRPFATFKIDNCRSGRVQNVVSSGLELLKEMNG